MKNPENASEEYECEYERIIKNIWKKKYEEEISFHELKRETINCCLIRNNCVHKYNNILC